MNTNAYPTLRTRVAVTFILLATLFGAVVSAALYIDFRNELYDNLRRRLETITTLAGLQQDGDLLLKVQAAGDEYFNRINEQNLKIRFSDPDIIYVYTMRKDEQGIYFVVDAGLPGETNIAAFGERYEDPGPALASQFFTMTKTIVEPEIYTDDYGTFLSAYTPIYASDGTKVGVLGVDISADTIRAQERAYLIRIITIFLSAVPFIVLAGFLAAGTLARPIIALRDAARKISQGELTYRISQIPHTRELAELAHDFNRMTSNLHELITELEQRVAERTANLTRKTEQLRTASFIARRTAEVQDLPSLLDTVVNLITERFGFYHTGIFLINETGEEAVLQAASSEGGKRMMEKGHALAVGKQGIVGYVAAKKQPHIAFDVGTDAVFFNNPDLPLTRSEIALPLIIRGKVLGVLDIQSDQPQAFNADDLDILQTLADQLAVAIDNARLLDESRAALMQLEALTGVRTREAWYQKLGKESLAYTYTPLGLRAEKPSSDEGDKTLKIPITLRGQKIGTITLARRDNTTWNKLDEDLVREVAHQVGLAVENIRLLEEATQRARQEQTVGELAARFSQLLDVDTLLQTAARELGQLPGVAEASVFIGEFPEQTPAYRRVKR
ncbi:MAG TPA: GAF domain-containing protein [Anaerolineales bacterium]|nr:GAF domain-containing protein [Anaerolineales bacterium]